MVTAEVLAKSKEREDVGKGVPRDGSRCQTARMREGQPVSNFSRRAAWGMMRTHIPGTPPRAEGAPPEVCEEGA